MTQHCKIKAECDDAIVPKDFVVIPECDDITMHVNLSVESSAYRSDKSVMSRRTVYEGCYREIQHNPRVSS